MKKMFFILLTALFAGTVTAQIPSVSILGDSYSTYEDFVTPATNELWYYAQNGEGKTDVKDVSQTWWHQVIKENGWRMCLNNSYSGATISYTGYDGNDYSARSFNTRMNNLGSPDYTGLGNHRIEYTRKVVSPDQDFSAQKRNIGELGLRVGFHF